MKILYVNWAPLWRGADVGGGVNLYSQSMAVKLSQLGHDLYSISSGFAYDLKNKAYIKRAPDYMGVANYEIFNAPNMAPGYYNYEKPMQDVSEPVVEKLFTDFIRHIRPDVVHFHNMEGFSAKCLSIAVKNGCRTLFSLHNYHPVCNQIYLLYKDRDICMNFEDGKKCLDCITPPSYSREIRKRRWAYHITRLPWGEKFWRKGRSAFNLPLFREIRSHIKTLPLNMVRKEEFAKDKHRLYAERRRANIQCLNTCHFVHSVSEFVKAYYIEKGVKPALIHTCHIGNKMAEVKSTVYQPASNFHKTKPVNIIFLGIASYPKGLPFFLETLHTMESRILCKINLHIYARGVWELHSSISEISRRLNSVKICDGYDFNALPNILSGMNYGVVPPLWYDNAPQVVFEMMAMKVPVVGAEIGGIPDFVRDMKNGILFKPGSHADLSSKLEMVVNNREIEAQLRENIRPMKTPDQHGNDLQHIYRNI